MSNQIYDLLDKILDLLDNFSTCRCQMQIRIIRIRKSFAFTTANENHLQIGIIRTMQTIRIGESFAFKIGMVYALAKFVPKSKFRRKICAYN